MSKINCISSLGFSVHKHCAAFTLEVVHATEAMSFNDKSVWAFATSRQDFRNLKVGEVDTTNQGLGMKTRHVTFSGSQSAGGKKIQYSCSIRGFSSWPSAYFPHPLGCRRLYRLLLDEGGIYPGRIPSISQSQWSWSDQASYASQPSSMKYTPPGETLNDPNTLTC